MWTQFWDMHSGGGQKEKWAHIYIEAPEAEAKVIFYNRFGHNPERVTCTCCGEDYATCEGESLEQLTAFHRGCAWVDGERDENGKWAEPGGGHYEERQSEGYRGGYGPYRTLDEYRKENPDVLFIPADEIKPEWRTGEVPEQGYVWRE